MAEEEKGNTSSGTTDEHTSLADDQVVALATLGASAGPPSKAELQAYLGKSAALRQTLAERGGHTVVAGVSLTVQQLRDALSALFAGDTERKGAEHAATATTAAINSLALGAAGDRRAREIQQLTYGVKP